MSDVNQDTKTTTEVDPQAQPAEVVARTEFDKVMQDLHRFKKQAKELEDRVKKKDEEDLKRQNDWQTYAQSKEKEADDARKEADALKSAIIRDRKVSVLKDSAVKAGLRQEAMEDLDLVDLSELQIETTSTGRVSVLGADRLVTKLKSTRPHWFSKAPSGVNTSSPDAIIPDAKVTYKQLLEAEKQAKSSGDHKAYRDMLLRFKEQNA